MEKSQRGYVMLTVLMILLLLLSAGAYALRAADTEQRSSGRFRRSEILFHAADAGASQRLAEASLAADPYAVFEDINSRTYRDWTTWPPATSAFTTMGGDVSMLRYRTGQIRMLWTGKAPPPGLPVGTNTYIFDFPAFSGFANRDPTDVAESGIRVSFKTWDTLPGSYAP